MSTQRYPRGSEWRKWDLHVHAPGTKLGDQYTPKDGRPDLARFCQIIHDSDVSVLAITDYFSFDSYFDVLETYRRTYGEDGKLLLPNLEVRLPVAVNRADQEVNLHLIFPPWLTRDVANKFLGRLKTEETTGHRTRVTCADLKTQQQFQSATVSLDSIESAIQETFGSHATSRDVRCEYVLVVASAKGDGIRAGGAGLHRKKLLSDEIDKYADAIFANAGSRLYFLNTARLESRESVPAKPVFDGSDAHSFEDLSAGLGQQIATDSCVRNITWIKADPTYMGLLQTLAEPASRVALQATKPDRKEPYKLISRVKFSGAADFPSEVLFNPNLNAIIGSRSSGKSALLAFVAHAVDPDETMRVQAEAAGVHESETGPAAGFIWNDVSHIECDVEWASGDNTTGKVIYIPQNALYALSEQPEEITRKITPVLFRAYPALKTAYENAIAEIAFANQAIENGVGTWFKLADRIDINSQEIRDLGDINAITAERDRLDAEIDEVKSRTLLTDEEVTKYQEIATRINDKEARVQELARQLIQLTSYVSLSEGNKAVQILPGKVQAKISVRPSQTDVPDTVSVRIDEIKAEAHRKVVSEVEGVLVSVASALENERASLVQEVAEIRRINGDLIKRHEANEELSALVRSRNRQLAVLDVIAKKDKERQKLLCDQQIATDKISRHIHDRDAAITALETAFNEEERTLIGMSFGIEVEVPETAAEHASIGINQRHTNEYIRHKGESVCYKEAQADPKKFLDALRSGRIRLNKNYDANAVAADVLAVTKEIRFFAEMDSDRIGGFIRSSMTPGKQALFALTLILNETEEPWPLLIDQPEDDLDSRSIYATIVPYLVERKQERQIIMVSHDANLVIGADSEEVIVANRHGDDRPNKDERTFEYLTGSLEYSQELNLKSRTILGRCGIREHACEILDGGEDAFRKRREKYKI